MQMPKVVLTWSSLEQVVPDNGCILCPIKHAVSRLIRNISKSWCSNGFVSRSSKPTSLAPYAMVLWTGSATTARSVRVAGTGLVATTACAMRFFMSVVVLALRQNLKSLGEA